MFTFGSLFAGIGGLDLGLERAGMACEWQVEIDGYCLKVLEKHWPDVRRYGDVRECGKHNLAPVDLVCGGFPCQDVSHAGKRRGLKEGTRTGLWYEFARIVRELGPRWVLAENVPGLLSVDSGRGMGTVLRDLAEDGYDIEWDCVPAAAFGAPHLRYRVFIVAHTSRPGGARQDGPEADRCRGDVLGPKAEVLQGANQDVADANGLGRARDGFGIFQSAKFRTDGTNPWQVEPSVGRMADGIPFQLDRLRCIGNAVVPQVAEWLGRRILGADARWR